MKRLIPVSLILMMAMMFSSTATAQSRPATAKRTVTTRTVTKTVKRAPKRVTTHTHRGKITSRRHHAHVRPARRPAARRTKVTTQYERVRGRRYLVTKKVTWRAGRKTTTVHRERAPRKRVKRARVVRRGRLI